MSPEKSRWQTEALAKTYLQGVRGAVPAADLQFEVVRAIVSAWYPKPDRVMDLGCGDGILGRMILESFAQSHVWFVDFSDTMLQAARDKVAKEPRATILKADFSSPEWIRPMVEHGPYDLILSGFSIHHQSDERKRELYGEIFTLLSPGGLFLNLEHVESATPSIEKLFDDFFVDHLVRFHKQSGSSQSRAEIEKTYYSRPDKNENLLAPVEDQCRWLREIGFKDVDCFFKVFELALFGGRKKSRTGESGHDDAV
jgi:tRNA (cmo5U34)-methyltransferase